MLRFAHLMLRFHCDKCGHEWNTRSTMPPKKCPNTKCQAYFSSGHLRALHAQSKSAALSDPYVSGVIDILVARAEPWASTIKGIVDAYRTISTAATPVKPSRKAV